MNTHRRTHRGWKSAACAAGVFACAWLGASTELARAQQNTARQHPPEFERVDQGVADANALSASYRDIGVDLRAPMHFDTVYRVDARSRLLRGVQRGTTGVRVGAYARAHGALVAVFPRSAYRDVAPGVTMAQVPAGTVYTLADASEMSHIDTGGLPAPSRPSSRLLSVPLVTRIQPGQPPAQRPTHSAEKESHAASPVQTASGPASIWTDEDYRRQRVTSLLDRALSAGTR